MDTSDHLLGRQPIMNRLEEVVGYELLFRSPRSLASAEFHNPFKATSLVMFDLLSSFGLGDIVGNKRAFINVTAEMLASDAVELLPGAAVGLELLDSVAITPDVVRRCYELKKRGFLIALDNHRYNPDYIELYDGIADIVKLDLIQTRLEEQYRFVDQLKRFPVKLLAEKVDSRHVYLRSKQIGFELFQGYFFARPSVIQKKRMGNVTGAFLRLKQQLRSDAEIGEIEETFKQHPSMMYKLLLLVNSVSYGAREKIRTVRHALTLVGMEQLRRWAQLAIFADDSGQGLDSALMDMAATRAAFMEELSRLETGSGRLIRHTNPDEAFLTGTLSILTDIYDISVDEILATLNLSDEIRGALVARDGDLGTLLCLAEMMERLELDEAAECLERLHVSLLAVLDCQKRAYSWRSRYAL